jgi:bifunctional enzyme CysN/CysC
MTAPAPRGLTVWLTGLPGSGKTTSAAFLVHALRAEGQFCAELDGDVLRAGVSADLGFSDEDRDENVRRAGEVALVLAHQGAVVVVGLISPRRAARDGVRARHKEGGVTFLEVHVAAPLEVCERRDPKSLYRKARAGTVAQMTGVDGPYEPPLTPELILATDVQSAVETGALLVERVRSEISGLDSMN